MSYPGEGAEASEFDEVQDGEVEEQGADGAGSDESDPDGLGEEPGEGAEASGDDDDAGADEGQAGEQAQVAAPARRQSASDVIRSLKAERKERDAELADLRRQIEGLTQGNTRQQTEHQQRLEQERMALMSPEERFDYLREKDRQEFEGRLGGIQQQLADSTDRTAFDSLCARNPAFAAVRDDVERSLAEVRRNGGNAAREVLATYHIGKRALERANGGGKTRQKARGQQNIQRQTVRPSSPRGDVAPAGRRGGSEADQRRTRLENIEI